ncbi:hypothetical protein ACFVR2_22895 [Gottfriedia sp. NPDC057991]|uniref:hypothetical protein n=1 Tax=Gottfriedia sp. NPDC057991 TaxID=3346298 RepID=UPI0036DD5854
MNGFYLVYFIILVFYVGVWLLLRKFLQNKSTWKLISRVVMGLCILQLLAGFVFIQYL